MMKIHDVLHNAKYLHRILFGSFISLYMLGALTGCRANTHNPESRANMHYVMLNRKMKSKSLEKMLLSQFRWPSRHYNYYTIHEVNGMVFHDGYLEVENSDCNNATPNTFSSYGKDYRQAADAGYKVKDTNQKIRYHLTGDMMTLKSSQHKSTLQTITYRLTHAYFNQDHGDARFVPIKLKRFGHKTAKIPKSIARSNMISMKVGSHIYHKGTYSLNKVQKD